VKSDFIDKIKNWESFQSFRKVSRFPWKVSGSFPVSQESFPKFPESFPKFPESFQSFRKVSKVSGKFPKVPRKFPETLTTRFIILGYFKKPWG
jgi:hypothetical protein